jgi:transmembrane sensor
MAREEDLNLPLSEQAAHWWAVLHDREATGSDHREFGDWVARSPERVEAYLQTARLMRALKFPTTRWPDTPPEKLIRDAKASPADVLPLVGILTAPPPPPAAPEIPTPQHGGRRKPRLGLRRRPLWGAAAALLIVVGSAWWLLSGSQQYRTRFGEQRSVLLDDGSRITLNTASAIEVDFGSRNRRLVRLLEGEALFEVAHDAARPFVVQSGEARVRAVGTQFDIYRRNNGTTVTVIEGRVAVLVPANQAVAGGDANPNSARAATPAVLVSGGEQVTIAPHSATPPPHRANLAAATAWTRRELVFDHRPLSEVADEFNRYNRLHIAIEGATLKDQEVTGVFRSDDPASFLSFLSNTPGIEIRETEDGTRTVTSRQR